MSAVRLDWSTRSIYSSTFYFKKYNVSEGKKLYISLNFNWIIFLLFSAFFIFFFLKKEIYYIIPECIRLATCQQSQKYRQQLFNIYISVYTHCAAAVIGLTFFGAIFKWIEFKKIIQVQRLAEWRWWSRDLKMNKMISSCWTEPSVANLIDCCIFQWKSIAKVWLLGTGGR